MMILDNQFVKLIVQQTALIASWIKAILLNVINV